MADNFPMFMTSDDPRTFVISYEAEVQGGFCEVSATDTGQWLGEGLTIGLMGRSLRDAETSQITLVMTPETLHALVSTGSRLLDRHDAESN